MNDVQVVDSDLADAGRRHSLLYGGDIFLIYIHVCSRNECSIMLRLERIQDSSPRCRQQCHQLIKRKSKYTPTDRSHHNLQEGAYQGK